jgi:hypothetical protein
VVRPEKAFLEILEAMKVAKAKARAFSIGLLLKRF